MALINQLQLFDKLKLYIDEKIVNVSDELRALFEEFGLDDIRDALPEIKIVADNIGDVITVAGISEEVTKVAFIQLQVLKVAYIDDDVTTVGDMAAEVIAVAGMQSEIEAILTEPLHTSILDAEDNAIRAEEALAETLLVQADVTAEGDVQVARVIAEGDTQETRLINIGDTAEDSAGAALASEQTADSWSSAPMNTEVTQYTWNATTDTMESAPIPNSRSAFHWQEIAKTAASGLTFQGTWDSVDCSLPPTPIPDPGELANGWFYIVSSIAGDQSSCPDMSEGDWIVWSGDLVGDTVVEGAWQLINWEFDWSAITGVTVNGLPTTSGQDLLPTTGGDMSAAINLDNNIALAARKVDLSLVNVVRVLATDILEWGNTLVSNVARGVWSFPDAIPTTDVAQGTAANEFTRKDYVDSRFSHAQAPVGIEVTSYGAKPIFRTLELDGDAYPVSRFPDLYAVIGDVWNNAFGQTTPPAGMFRLPVSQDVLLVGLTPEGDADLVTYRNNTAATRISPLKCVWSGVDVGYSQYVNSDLIGNIEENNGFYKDVTYSHDDFALDVDYNVGFGIFAVFSHDDLSVGFSYNNGFSTFSVYTNSDFQLNEASNSGFTYA
ncbi:MAG: hypothetical protein DRP58_03245 [Spirochaetes bacterium]|nr:MAG: hypothetical protein DRP58_03245 [Spirochaetota bacterium]